MGSMGQANQYRHATTTALAKMAGTRKISAAARYRPKAMVQISPNP
jgi:hypothetical protein